jgi:hypothetical protein
MAETKASGNNTRFPDDYSLTKLLLITPKNTIDIRSMMVEVSYFEDIFRGSVTGEILISDSISMIDRLGLCGGEFLNLVFKKAAGEVSKIFRIYRVSERVLQKQELEVYTLHFCSEEFFYSEQKKISKSYKGKKISEIANDVLSKELLIQNNYINIHETKGLYDLIVPYKSPFEALQWLTNYALADTYSGADFMFFENSGGFNFVSLQKLYTQAAYDSYKYDIKNIGDLGNDSELQRDFKGFKSYTYLDTFDTLYGTVNGAFASKTLSIDPTTRRFFETNFDYNKDYYFKNVQLNNSRIINNTPNREKKRMNEMYDSTYKVVVSNKGQVKAKGIAEEPWSVQNDVAVETFVPYRTAQMSLSHYTRLKVVLSGDPNLSVGRIIKVTLPSSASKSDGVGYNEGEIDYYHSGRYLISAVRHMIKADLRYECVLEVVKDSLGIDLPNWNNPGIQNIVNGVTRG